MKEYKLGDLVLITVIDWDFNGLTIKKSICFFYKIKKIKFLGQGYINVNCYQHITPPYKDYVLSGGIERIEYFA